MEEIEIKTINYKDSEFPFLLKEIPDFPREIFVKGRIPKGIAVSIVGTRNMSPFGEKKASEFTQTLVKNGIIVVSGLARGIDSVVHSEAIKSGGKTIAVLGSGLDILYPPENKNLATEISQNGALISEFPLGTKPLPENFLRRNRIISGLSLAVLVIEGKLPSGTLSTSTHAANQGREVFAVPGPSDSLNSQVTRYLIDQGASIANTPEDILNYLKNVI